MSELGIELADDARTRLGAPFRHHYKPENLCDYGARTEASCMERGMDNTGYDCSGLVVAGMCRVLGIEASAWPRHLRHTKQIVGLAEDGEGDEGDIRLFIAKTGLVHIGIATSPETTIHASGLSKLVEEGEVSYSPHELVAIRALSAERLRRTILQEL